MVVCDLRFHLPLVMDHLYLDCITNRKLINLKQMVDLVSIMHIVTEDFISSTCFSCSYSKITITADQITIAVDIVKILSFVD